ncbi:unnamed protein product [Eretmochelys imbricata]
MITTSLAVNEILIMGPPLFSDAVFWQFLLFGLQSQSYLRSRLSGVSLPWHCSDGNANFFQFFSWSIWSVALAGVIFGIIVSTVLCVLATAVSETCSEPQIFNFSSIWGFVFLIVMLLL